MSKKKEYEYGKDHPCLCDICLKARDTEIARVRKFERERVITEIDKKVVEQMIKYTNTPLKERPCAYDELYEIRKILDQLKGKEKMTNIKIKKDEEEPESVELLAKSVIQVAEGFERISNSPLTTGALVILLREGIGESKISKKQIRLVIEALPRLKGWYIRD